MTLSSDKVLNTLRDRPRTVEELSLLHRIQDVRPYLHRLQALGYALPVRDRWHITREGRLRLDALAAVTDGATRGMERLMASNRGVTFP